MPRRYSEAVKYLPVATLKLSEDVIKENNLEKNFDKAIFYSNKYGLLFIYFNQEVKVVKYTKISDIFYQESEQLLQSEDVLSKIELNGKFISLHLSANEDIVILVQENKVYLFEIGLFTTKVSFNHLGGWYFHF